MKEFLQELRALSKYLKDERRRRAQLRKLIDRGADYELLLSLVRLAATENQKVILELPDKSKITITDFMDYEPPQPVKQAPIITDYYK